MAVPKVIMATMLTFALFALADSKPDPKELGATIRLVKRGVIGNLVKDLTELEGKVPQEDLDDLMKDVMEIEKHVPKEVLDDLTKKVEKLKKLF